MGEHIDVNEINNRALLNVGLLKCHDSKTIFNFILIKQAHCTYFHYIIETKTFRFFLVLFLILIVLLLHDFLCDF